MYRRSSQKGFTLIEILIVVALLDILAAITIPMFQQYVGRAKKNSAAIRDMKNFKTGMEAYFADNQSYPKL